MTAAEGMPVGSPPTLPYSAWTGSPYDGYTVPGLIDPEDPHGGVVQWKPPGIAGPWPRDEYLFDGGDELTPADVAPDWSVHGLEMEDTIAHYDTLDGRTVVEPSNKVCLYAPRFASVRKVSGMMQHEQQLQSLGYVQRQQLERQDELTIASTVLQPVQPNGQIGTKEVNLFRERVRGVGLENAQKLAGFDYGFLPYENLLVIRQGVMEQSEKARLAQAVQAAIVWTDEQAVQVMIEKQTAALAIRDQRAEATYQYELAGKPRLQIVKIASTHDARPGEMVDFTIRYDNIGTQRIGNVTIIDNLTTRLEYVPETAQSNLKADFFTQQNEGDSLVLRWEIIEPLEPGQGGILRFRCRVR